MSGTNDKLAGKVKEGWGKATGDRVLESKGKGQHAVGNVKDAAKDIKEMATDQGEHAVGAVTDVARHVKDRVIRR